MKTKAEFLARFELPLAGFGAWGVMIDSIPPERRTLGHAARALAMPEQAAKLLNAMYAFLAEPETVAPAVNEQVKQPQQKVRT